jgi:adenylate cyclase
MFDDEAMSRRHALVQQFQPNKFYLVDLGSTNGSLLNGRRISTSVELHDGDTILCGETTLVFRQRPGQPGTGGPTADNGDHISIESDNFATRILYKKRLMTVLVVDIRGFTQLAQQIDESLLAQTMGTWFRELGSLLRGHGCTTDKYIGDAAMAVWVHEDQIPDHRQIRRVLGTLLQIEDLTSGLHRRFLLPSPICIGAGINTGLSVMGNSGPGENPDFSPLGDSVNKAFRLESATKKTEFNVALGALTFQCLNGDGATNYFEKRPLKLKGYPQPEETWLISYPSLKRFLSGEL